MKKELIQKKVLYLLLVFACLCNTAFSRDTSFHRVDLSYGISLDIPRYWLVLSQDSRKNLAALSEALTKKSGVERPSGRKKSLIAVSAKPDPTGAMIRVSIISPPDFTQAELAATTPAELKDGRVEVLSMFKKMEASGGPKIIEMQPLRIEKVNNRLALVLPYIRAGVKGPSPWQVIQYKIPVSKGIIEVTLSHRQSDAIVWRPILEYVKRSLRF